MILNNDEMKKVKLALNVVWQTIGADIIKATGRKNITKDEVVVVSLHYLYDYGNLHKNILKKFLDLPYKNREKIAKQSFIHNTYGL